MSLVLWKFYGHLASIWNRLQSCLSYLWYPKPGKPNQSRLIICLLLDLTELSTLSTGSTATTQKVSKYISGVYIIFEWSIKLLKILLWFNHIYSFADFYDIIAIVAGCVQTILYCDFFYLYITKVLKGKKLQLPA